MKSSNKYCKMFVYYFLKQSIPKATIENILSKYLNQINEFFYQVIVV